jgi:hypothetical protein
MKFDTDTTATAPSSGFLKVNNADQTLATELYTSDTTFPGNNADIIYENLLVGEYIGLWQENADREVYYYITAAPINNGTWWTIPVAYVSGTAGITNNANIKEFFIANPNEKLPEGGTTGQALVKSSDVNWDTEWGIPLGSSPTGGDSGAVLRKSSGQDYDSYWSPTAAPDRHDHDGSDPSGGLISHSNLTDRSATNSHPISAITELVNVLTDMDNYSKLNTRVWFTADVPTNEESSEGDLWLSSTVL